MNKLNNKTALITGCNRGIGRAIMELFMQEGANIVACTRTITSELEVYYERSESQYAIKIYPLCFDLSDEDSVKTAMKKLYALKINIDILINNAGVASFSPFMMTRISNIKTIFQVNFFSPLIIMQYVIKLMVKVGVGSIVNMSSISAIDSNVGNLGYGASKAAVISQTRTLAKELSSRGIRVNALAPGFINTDMHNHIDNNIKDDMINQSSLKRLGTPEEIAKAALFLVSDDSSYITGQIIRVDGGM